MALDTSEVLIGNTETEIAGALGTGSRTYLQIINLGPQTIWIGPTGVTPETGFPIYVRRAFRGNNVMNLHDETIYGITNSGYTCKVRLVEAN